MSSKKLIEYSMSLQRHAIQLYMHNNGWLAKKITLKIFLEH